MIYKVSYVVIGQPHPGEIINQDEPPQVGDQVTLGGALFEVVEVIDLAPPHVVARHMEAIRVQDGYGVVNTPAADDLAESIIIDGEHEVIVNKEKDRS